MTDESPPNEATDAAIDDMADGAIDAADAVDEAPPGTVDAESAADDRSTDLDRVAADLDGVEAALARLDDGSYWTDEVTGEQIDEAVLRADPVARRNPAGA